MRLACSVLAVLSGCTHLVWYGRSPDRRHVAAVIERGGAQLVRHDLRDGVPYAGVGLEGLRMDGAHLAYPARLADGRWVVVVDGRAGEAFDAIGEVLLDGAQVLYAAERAGRWFVVDGARRSGPWDELFASTLRRWKTPGSRDGVAVFVARRDNKAWVVAGAHEYGPFDAVGQLSASTEQLDFTARTSEGLALHAVPAGAAVSVGTTGAWDDVTALQRAGARLFMAHDGEGWHVVHEVPGPPFERIAALSLHDGRPLYAARRQGEEWVVHGEQRFGPFRALKQQLFGTAAGVRFVARHADGWWVHRGEQTLGPFADVSALQSAGAHDAFLAERDERTVVFRDGVELSRWEFAHGLVLHASGRVAFVARVGAQNLLVDDERTTPFDLLLPDTLVFSRDGKHLAAVTGEAKTRALFITFDDGARVPVDLEELTAELMRAPPATLLSSPDGAVLRRWVEAELRIRFPEE